MQKNDERRESDTIEFGVASIETKGPPAIVQLDAQGNFGTSGLSDD